jgi:hypothetical protein
VRDLIAHLIGWGAAFALRAPGRHSRRHVADLAPVPVPVPLARRAAWVPLAGEGHTGVRPYVVAHEHRVYEQQLTRRRALYLATWGLDIEPLRVHGMGVGQ